MRVCIYAMMPAALNNYTNNNNYAAPLSNLAPPNPIVACSITNKSTKKTKAAPKTHSPRNKNDYNGSNTGAKSNKKTTSEFMPYAPQQFPPISEVESTNKNSNNTASSRRNRSNSNSNIITETVFPAAPSTNFYENILPPQNQFLHNKNQRQPPFYLPKVPMQNLDFGQNSIIPGKNLEPSSQQAQSKYPNYFAPQCNTYPTENYRNQGSVENVGKKSNLAQLQHQSLAPVNQRSAHHMTSNPPANCTRKPDTINPFSVSKLVGNSNNNNSSGNTNYCVEGLIRKNMDWNDFHYGHDQNQASQPFVPYQPPQQHEHYYPNFHSAPAYGFNNHFGHFEGQQTVQQRGHYPVHGLQSNEIIGQPIVHGVRTHSDQISTSGHSNSVGHSSSNSAHNSQGASNSGQGANASVSSNFDGNPTIHNVPSSGHAPGQRGTLPGHPTSLSGVSSGHTSSLTGISSSHTPSLSGSTSGNTPSLSGISSGLSGISSGHTPNLSEISSGHTLSSLGQNLLSTAHNAPSSHIMSSAHSSDATLSFDHGGMSSGHQTLNVGHKSSVGRPSGPIGQVSHVPSHHAIADNYLVPSQSNPMSGRTGHNEQTSGHQPLGHNNSSSGHQALGLGGQNIGHEPSGHSVVASGHSGHSSTHQSSGNSSQAPTNSGLTSSHNIQSSSHGGQITSHNNNQISGHTGQASGHSNQQSSHTIPSSHTSQPPSSRSAPMFSHNSIALNRNSNQGQAGPAGLSSHAEASNYRVPAHANVSSSQTGRVMGHTALTSSTSTHGAQGQGGYSVLNFNLSSLFPEINDKRNNSNSTGSSGNPCGSYYNNSKSNTK